MSDLTRFGISINTQLLQQFDDLIADKGYMNRSEAIRDLIRKALIEEQAGKDDEEIIGTITLVYNHHTRELAKQLTHHQHSHHESVLSSLHIHLDAENCLEVIVVKGRSRTVRQMADEMIGTRGVKHGKLVITSSGESLG